LSFRIDCAVNQTSKQTWLPTTSKSSRVLPQETSSKAHPTVTHPGVCGTDQHYRPYDMVLGHEGVGIVEAIGPDVKALKLQETAPVGARCTRHAGYMSSVWRAKSFTAPYGTGDQDQGSFGEGAVWREQLLFRIPDNLPSDAAAPLMCAGITVWEPLTEYNVKPSDVVGRTWPPGCAVRNQLGCEVVALSGTETKRDEALKLGAHHFVATKGVSDLKVPRKINHLLVTTSQIPDWNQYKSILAPRPSISPLTITDFETKLVLPHMQFILSGWKLIGSTGSPKIVYQRMLDFAGLHIIKPMIELFPLTKQGVVDSLKKLDEGKMRYRGVLYAGGV
ncbi:putative cinnamyl alcohol dehydrogenase 1, partial [Lachnellula cervina]